LYGTAAGIAGEWAFGGFDYEIFFLHNKCINKCIKKSFHTNMKLRSTFSFPVFFIVAAGIATVPPTTLPTAPWVANGVVTNPPPPQDGTVWLVSWGVYTVLVATRSDIAMFDPATKSIENGQARYGGLITPSGAKTLDDFEV
jgi:hypothetical protein